MTSEDDDTPLDIEAMMSNLDHAAMARSAYGIFYDAVENYRATEFEAARENGADHRSIHNLVCPNGQPATEIGGQPLFWRTGLSSIFSLDRSDILAEISAQHHDAMSELYKVWSDGEGEPEFEPMYDFDRPAKDPDSPELKLAPDLAIEDRHRLSDFYIDTVLKPYERAQIACRDILWTHLEETHNCGAWVGFRPTQSGSYVPILPTAGFDNQGNYRVNRKAYITGFRFTQNDISEIYLRESADYSDQESWIFICTADLPAIQKTELVTSQQALAKKKSEARIWMSKVGKHFAMQGRKASSTDIKMVARERYGLSQNAVDQAWKTVAFANKSDLGSIPRNLRVNINEIREIN